MSDWLYQEKPITELPDKVIGFVYCITNNLDGRKYIGKKKGFRKKTSIKTIILKSGVKKKKKIRTIVNSDWMEYFGSSSELCADIEKLGADNFTREILHLCYSLSELSYIEAELQFKLEVLKHQDRFYNRWIMVRVRADHLKGKLK